MHHDPELQRQAEATVKENRFLAMLRRWRWFSAFVLLPSLFGILYFGFIAADIYVSESRFVIKGPDQKQSGGGAIGAILQGGGFGGGQDQASEIIGFIQSRDALSGLTENIDVRGAFASQEADFFSRFPLIHQTGSFEDLFTYYGSMVSALPDPQTGLTQLSVKAFTPEEAQSINLGLLRLSEELVNRLNQRVNSQAIDEAEARVAEAQVRVRDARIRLGAYRNTAEILDPQQQGLGVLAVSDGLITQEAALRAQLTQIRRIAGDHPSIPALEERIAAVSQQIASQTARAVGTPDGLASRLTEYENLIVEQEFATQLLTVANAALEQARVEAERQQYYIERVVEPNLPDAAILPARLKNILAVIFASLCLYLVGWMLAVGIREHAPEE
ncbi:capsule biosynthesis protein [Erythrobacter ani]|uniref:Capsule biosynthesis protein n=1 Tax=Erythrobacter ani TaxID=2827235 RepID=A0ABS6SMV7_9SPHN|nr:capsule biosynthesis protein [Erythrobacter ani]MBV7266324.1 capsule biosynthesis protein [Erythrobacter ani]